MTPARFLSALLAGACAVPAALLTVLGLWPPLQFTHRVLAMAGAFIPYGLVLWVLAGLAVLAAARNRWRLLALPCALGLALHLAWAGVYLPGTPPPASASTLRIAALNTLYGKSDAGIAAARLAEADPDVIVLLEASAPFVDTPAMAALLARYPHRVGRTAPGWSAVGYEDASATLVASRRPLTELARLDSGFDQFAVRTTTVDGREITLLAVHPMNMVQGTDLWRSEAETVAAAVQDHRDEPLVVIGDLNATRENATYPIMAAGLTDAALQSGAGWRPTFDGNLALPPLIAIDHALVNDRVVASRLGTFAVPGTDHQGIVVDVSLV
ncbi:endonuclease/exonuclease/phosphatase family protein [Propioniciclava sp.]|uniref:endonuclease/exonuclease/phosphatase family protein n=1 Tax=Propioniciclava sp. TaxID=2038686 RepID=UPI0026347150|nr:endonuclease/exonuclease/phosphatase family protein [Propioniciclava sp.]